MARSVSAIQRSILARWEAGLDTAEARPARRFDQCDDTCTVDCGHCKGNHALARERRQSDTPAAYHAEVQRLRASREDTARTRLTG
jgi:hypothetical protein